ncbi:TRNA/rRNA methyltransferase [hydrothermal vent metagenome]|uniref:tRNA/rRNA methyltransferase n=1 Tax=hydrothermal vent metagenome TaxID=652676 RepID=A0A3B0WJB7_9ZZZZ
MQLTHTEHKPSNNKFPLCIVAYNISSPNNVGSLFRLCDAMGIEKLYLCGNTAVPPNSKINKTSRSTEKHVDFEYHSSAENLVTKLKASNYLIISLEITTTSVAINSPSFSNAPANDQAICLILGSENTGINQTLLNMSDITTHIKMHGNNSSMNVISAASIACYEITKNL